MENELEIINVILIAISLLLIMSFSIILFFFLSRKKIIKTQLEKASLEIEYQKELLQNTLLTQEEERKRIAQDLHDAISSKLNIVSLNASLLEDKNISSEEVHKIGKGIYKVTSTVLENSRRIAHDLLPPTLERFGLQAALEELCEEILETQKYTLEYQLVYKEGFLNSQEELHLFRIVQELFNNSIKHANASIITLEVTSKENKLSLKYTDNGKGFEIDEAKKVKGLGMSGIENRVIIINGLLDVKSSPNKGIQVKITKTIENEY